MWQPEQMYIDRPEFRRTFPVMREMDGMRGHYCVPWIIGAQAWGVYAQSQGCDQSAARIAERGGFGECEMDVLRPGWRDRIIEERT